MRTPLGFLLGVGLACGSAPARGEDAERHAVTGFVADCRAGKAPEACAVWWDGESVGARVFVAEWAAQPEGVRAEIGGLLAKAIQGEARELLAAAQAVAQGGGVKFEQDEPISLPDADGLRAVAVPMRLAVGKKQQAVRLRLLLTRSSPPRLTDWAWDEHPWTPQERAEGTFTLKLFRKNVERAARDHFTRVRLGESQTIDLPPRGDDPDAVAAEVWAPVREALRVAAASRGAAPATCAVLMPYPSGPAVPLEDVLAAVQLVQEAGLSVVALSGG